VVLILIVVSVKVTLKTGTERVDGLKKGGEKTRRRHGSIGPLCKVNVEDGESRDKMLTIVIEEDAESSDGDALVRAKGDVEKTDGDGGEKEGFSC